MLQTTLRLVASLAVVVGLMILLARLAGRRMRGGNGSVVKVLHRQPLTRGSGVAVVEVGGRMLVLGTTEQQVSLLTELDPYAMDGELLDVTEVAGLAHHASLEQDASVSPLFPVRHQAGAHVDRTATSALDPHTPGGTDVAPAPDPAAASAATTLRARGGSHRAARPVAQGSALSGSILAPSTWRQAVAAVTGRAS